VLARWYHEGLGAFEKNVHGATEILDEVEPDLAAAMERPGKLEKLITQTQDLRAKVAKKLERGHDRLLELNSCKPARAANLIAAIRTLDSDAEFEEFFLRVLDHYGVHVEDLAPRSYVLKPGTMVSRRFLRSGMKARR
jgi:ATP-dependent helicase HepA